jgi:uncharacterized protein YxjI
MATNYLITRKRSLGAGLSITDETGTPRFEVQGRFGFSKNLTMRDAAGAPVAVVIAIEAIRDSRRRAAEVGAASSG